MTGSGNLQAVLHESLLATGHVECCAAISRRDGEVRASSVGYEVSQLAAVGE